VLGGGGRWRYKRAHIPDMGEESREGIKLGEKCDRIELGRRREETNRKKEILFNGQMPITRMCRLPLTYRLSILTCNSIRGNEISSLMCTQF
jgi:hypothetical protein